MKDDWYEEWLDYEDSRANGYLSDVSADQHYSRTKVTTMNNHNNQYDKWRYFMIPDLGRIRRRKFLSAVLMITGFCMVFSIEQASIWWGVWGNLLFLIGILLARTTRHRW